MVACKSIWCPLILSETIEKSIKHSPPAIIIDQWVYPRHIISIDPYPTAPIRNRRGYFFILLLAILLSEKSFLRVVLTLFGEVIR